MKHLLLRISPEALQVLHFLMVSQDCESSKQAEFATMPSLPFTRWSVAMAVAELESIGLISIIAHEPYILPHFQAPNLPSVTQDSSKEEAPTPINKLTELWDELFPKSQYPPLDEDTAQTFLNGRSFPVIERVMREAVKNATSKIHSPKSFIRTALERHDKYAQKKTQDQGAEEEIITEDLRNLVRWRNNGK